PVDTPNDLYKKVGALFNMLELKHEVQTVCCILTLLDHPNVSLTESQKQFFRELLDEQVPNLEKVKKRLAELRQTAEVIDHKLKRKSGAYRVAIADKTLSVREDGLALLYSPEIQTSPSVLLANSSPPGMHAEIIPELFIFIPDAEIDKAKQTIHQQYRTGNMILALMVVLGGVLGGGIFIAVHRQRELDAMKTNFIATVSHELRTPLSLIRLHAETLHHGRVSEDKVHDYHQTILTESERLSGIVNNVLDFSRIERNKLQLHIESTDISALCKQIAESFRFRLEKDGFELEKQIQPGIVVPADPLAVSQILFNLMDNAIKYSDGEKSIRLELERSGDQAILRVADRGIGIPDKLKKHIFDEFVRSNDSKASARRGSGIGLSVARRLAEEMGASIEVVDNKPTGTIFTVSLAGGSTNEAAIS
ncbi:MAG: HAMP domain-containing sensor histidine kinase, partial [Verrucomicrobiota bacterium]